jgi:hypothetical protein
LGAVEATGAVEAGGAAVSAVCCPKENGAKSRAENINVVRGKAHLHTSSTFIR